jgi:hypothetical protein
LPLAQLANRPRTIEATATRSSQSHAVRIASPRYSKPISSQPRNRMRRRLQRERCGRLLQSRQK